MTSISSSPSDDADQLEMIKAIKSAQDKASKASLSQLSSLSSSLTPLLASYYSEVEKIWKESEQKSTKIMNEFTKEDDKLRKEWDGILKTLVELLEEDYNETQKTQKNLSTQIPKINKEKETFFSNILSVSQNATLKANEKFDNLLTASSEGLSLLSMIDVDIEGAEGVEKVEEEVDEEMEGSEGE